MIQTIYQGSNIVEWRIPIKYMGNDFTIEDNWNKAKMFFEQTKGEASLKFSWGITPTPSGFIAMSVDGSDFVWSANSSETKSLIKEKHINVIIKGNVTATGEQVPIRKDNAYYVDYDSSKDETL